MGSNKTYWNGLEQLNEDARFVASQKDEFADELPIEEQFSEESLGVKSSRRDFLKVFGFGLTAATIAACQKPIKQAIPYVIKPEDVTPGVASWYASTCTGCAAACGVLIKTREGRPIKIEGNPASPHSQGGTCAVGQATVLSLYDSGRLRGSKVRGAAADWAGVDKAVGDVIAAAKSGGKVRVLSNSMSGITSRKAVQAFLSQFPDGKHVVYDAISYSGILDAHQSRFGKRSIPAMKFDQAEVVVSFGADFLGTWISPIEFTKAYTKLRKVSEDNPKMSRHFQFESNMSLTGSNADMRFPLKPSDEGKAILGLYDYIAGKTGNGAVSGGGSHWRGPGNVMDKVGDALLNARGKSLVVCGTNDVHMQMLVIGINEMLGNYGATLDMAHPSQQWQSNDTDVMALMQEVKNKEVALLVIMGANPVYELPNGEAFGADLKNIFAVQLTAREDETSASCAVVAASHHGLESWGDANPRAGEYALQQPVIRPIYKTRQAEESLLAWAGITGTYHDYLKQNWEQTLFPTQARHLLFSDFWQASLHDGVYTSGGTVVAAPVAEHADAHGDDHGKGKDKGKAKPHAEETHAEPAAEAAASNAVGSYSEAAARVSERAAQLAKGMELVIYPKVSIRDGKLANNPWLQEMPDPISKVTWDNYVCVSYVDAQEKGWKDGDMVTLKANGKALKGELPVLVQPGQAKGTFAVALGYGRTVAGKVADNLGQNAYALVGSGSNFSYAVGGAEVSPSGGAVELAKTQTYIGYELEHEGGAGKREEIEDRISDFILKETTLSEYLDSRIAGNKRPSDHHMVSLWDNHDRKGHHWAMAIDLNACTGCGNCIVSCNAENNIPVVGRAEVLTRREMHWMRIDRYFKGNPADQDGQLQVMHQPLMCQHCNNAPCESVCPVLATTHSDEGLNQQTYNRCIGTRYCANNCPYKVRRFNWFSYYENDKFDYNMNDKLGKLVLNPDVTIRARGVMEKCSFCVQRIQAGKLQAKVEGSYDENGKMKDGSIKTACQQSCPADAIVFGDLNDPNSEISKLYMNKRAYHALEDVKTLPNVAYLTKVRNVDSAEKNA